MLLGAVHQGLGRSMGSIVAGRMQTTIGTSSTFLYLAFLDALFAAVAAILYGTFLTGTKKSKPKQD